MTDAADVDDETRRRPVTALVTMDFHPQPEAARQALGVPRARARRPGQRADRAALPPAPASRWSPSRSAWTRRWTPSPAGSTASPRSWRTRCPEGTDKHTRRGVRRRAGALRRDPRRARRPPGRAPLAGGSRSPACPGRWGCWPTRCARPPSRTSEIERLVRNRLDGIPHRAGQPGPRAPPRQLSHGAVPGVRADVPAPPGHRGDRRADRRGGRARLLRGSRAARHGHRGRRG